MRSLTKRKTKKMKEKIMPKMKEKKEEQEEDLHMNEHWQHHQMITQDTDKILHHRENTNDHPIWREIHKQVHKHTHTHKQQVANQAHTDSHKSTDRFTNTRNIKHWPSRQILCPLECSRKWRFIIFSFSSASPPDVHHFIKLLFVFPLAPS